MIELIAILFATTLNIGIGGFVLCKYFTLSMQLKEDQSIIKGHIKEVDRLVLQVNEIDKAVGLLEAEQKPIKREDEILREDLLKTLDSSGLFDSVEENTMKGFR